MPLSFLASGIGRLVIVGLSISALSLGLYAQICANGRLRAERNHAFAINEQNLAVIGAEKEATKRANQVAATEMANAEVWRRRYNAMRAEIVNAKPEDDGPIAPVLRRVLDRLPEPDDNKTHAVPSAGSAGKSHPVSGHP